MVQTSTQKTAELVLNKETDARFWTTTGYKPGQKLDMSIPTDRAMAGTWGSIHAQVVAEDQAGNLRLTYNDPAVQAKIAQAAAASSATVANLNAAQQAAGAGDQAARDAHLANAAASHQDAQQATADAQAIAQPPAPPHEVVTASANAAAAAPPPADADAAHHVAQAQATQAPHTAAGARRPFAPPKQRPGTLHPTDLAAARGEAPSLANNALGDFVGVLRVPGSPQGAALAFPSRELLVAWYNRGVVDAAVTGAYIAAFDKRDPAWPGPIADGIGGEAAIIVTAQPPGPPVVVVQRPGAQPQPQAPQQQPPLPDAPPLATTQPKPDDGKSKHGLITGIGIAAGAAALAALAYFTFGRKSGGGRRAPRGGRVPVVVAGPSPSGKMRWRP